MANDTKAITIWERAFYKSGNPFTSFFDFNISSIFQFSTICLSLFDAVTTFTTTLYLLIPPFVERVASVYTNCIDFINTVTSTSEGLSQQVGEVVTTIENNQISDSGSGLWDLVKYMVNLDALTDSIDFLFGVAWIWITLVVAVLLIATALLLSGSVLWVTRRTVCFLSAGFIKV